MTATSVPQSILQLIPGAPPQINGVSDYAFAVARALRDNWAIESTFLVCSPSWAGPNTVDDFRLIPLRSRRGPDLCEAIQRISKAGMTPPPVLLQLSPYGYDVNGSPFWLLKGLRQWKRTDAKAGRLITYFHELYATSMPWRKGFWVSPQQRICSREIARLSDVALTSMERYVERLEAWAPAKKGLIPRMPVVSNVGEPSHVPELGERPRQLVIWGSAVAKKEIYGPYFGIVKAAVDAIGIERIVDVGQSWNESPSKIAGVPVTALGILAPAELSKELTNSALAIFSSNANCLGKSGTFAAFCAHGVPAVCLPTHAVEQKDWDGIRRGAHYITSAPVAGPGGMAALVQIGKIAREWYLEHPSREHARVIAKMMVGGSDPGRPGDGLGPATAI